MQLAQTLNSRPKISGYLNAPGIAGLIPARAESLHRKEPDGINTFTYENNRLSEIDTSKHQCLIIATQKLLDVAVAFALGEMSEAALRAAEVIFHRSLAGPSTTRPRNPSEYCAEKDADILDWFLSQSSVPGQEQAQRDVAILQRRAV